MASRRGISAGVAGAGADRLFFTGMRNASGGSRNVPGLAAASNFLDLTSRAGPIIHKDALADRQVAFGGFILKNLRLSHPYRQEQSRGHQANAQSIHGDRLAVRQIIV
jgi:hypothetical protein